MFTTVLSTNALFLHPTGWAAAHLGLHFHNMMSLLTASQCTEISLMAVISGTFNSQAFYLIHYTQWRHLSRYSFNVWKEFGMLETRLVAFYLQCKLWFTYCPNTKFCKVCNKPDAELTFPAERNACKTHTAKCALLTKKSTFNLASRITNKIKTEMQF